MRTKEIKWYVVDSAGKRLELNHTREAARDAKKWYEENALQDWMGGFNFPLKIIREQWELTDKKVVR
ncbi:hypothetical protein D3C71_1836310 [compost metagenome]